MVRRPIAVLLVTAALCLSAAAATPEASLDLGVRAFKAGDYASARVDLETAVAGLSGANLETALVYLALAQFRLGDEDASRASIQRLLEIERVTPMYATLPLQQEAAEFETLVAALVPDANLTPNGETHPAEAAPLPAVQAAIPREPEPVVVEEPVVTQPVVTQPVLTMPPLPARPPAVALDSTAVRNALNSLRQAEALADQGELREAQEIYARLAATEPREIVAAAAVGLYRIGAYREAVQAFRRLGALGRGEEDLHYYFAVSLYESGEYEPARRELMCALPYIELTDEVARYRIKIEQALINQS